jgi:hypothetical protein
VIISLIVLLIGYLIIFFYSEIESYVLFVGFGFLMLFSFYLFIQRIQRLHSWNQRLHTLFAILIFNIIIFALIYYSIRANILSIYLFPIIFAVLVLLRKLLKKIINLRLSDPKSYGQMSKTDKGDIVKSKSEKTVADWLHENNYDYEYEKEIDLGSDGKIISDFYLTKEDIYIEYWGLSTANNEAGEKYRARKNEKYELYEQNGLKLLSIYPHHLYELDKYIPQQIEILSGKSKGISAWISSLFGGNRTVKQTHATQKSNDIEETLVYEYQTTPEESEKFFCTSCGNADTKPGEFCVKCGSLVE